MNGLFESLTGIPMPGFEFSPFFALRCYMPKAKKSEMATDWQEGRPPENVFCEVFHRGQVVPGVREGWTFYSTQKDVQPWANRTLDAASITAWRIPVSLQATTDLDAQSGHPGKRS